MFVDINMSLVDLLLFRLYIASCDVVSRWPCGWSIPVDFLVAVVARTTHARVVAFCCRGHQYRFPDEAMPSRDIHADFSVILGFFSCGRSEFGRPSVVVSLCYLH